MKKNKYIIILLCAITIMAISCKGDDVTAPQYMQNWQLSKNSVSSVRRLDNLELTMTYLPNEFLIINDLGGQVPQSEYNKELSQYCEHIYCTLRIKNENSLKENNSFNVPKFFARDRQKQFIGVFGKDTLPCVLYQPELMSNNTLETTVNLVFLRPNSQPCEVPITNDMTFLFSFNDSLKQVTKFDINKNAINKLPKLKF